MKASTFIAQYLEKQGVTTVFEMSGGMITHILDSIYLEKKIRILSNHHEQAAAFAADGYARMSGVPGVALATSGPGATNLITGIGCCYFDSTPAVFITGQVDKMNKKAISRSGRWDFKKRILPPSSSRSQKQLFGYKKQRRYRGYLRRHFALRFQTVRDRW